MKNKIKSMVMIRSLLSGILVLCMISGIAQVQTQIIGDSVRVHGNTGTAELILENNTQNVNGFLFNKGNGRTEFRRGVIKLNDSMYLIGADTLKVSSLSTPLTRNGILYNSSSKYFEFGNEFSDEWGPAIQMRPTVYNQNSHFFNWATGANGVLTFSKYKMSSSSETNPLSAYYIARFANGTQGGLLLENTFKGPSVWAFPQMWLNFKNNHSDAKKYSFFGDSIVATITNGTRTGSDGKVYSILDMGSASDSTFYDLSILKLFPAFTAASGGPIKLPTASIKRLDISNGVSGAMYNLTSLSYNNPYSRLVIDANSQPIVIANLPTGGGNPLVVDSSGKVWKSSSSYIDASATLDFPNTTAGNSSNLTITVTGASDGDVVSIGVPNASVNTNGCFTAWVSAANTVTVRFNNYSSSAINPASGTFKVKVLK